MAADDILLDVEDRMDKAVAKLKNDLSGIRTGRANPGLVDSLKVEIYGSQTPMKQLANVGAPEPQQLVIRPYDPGTIKDIERAIGTSEYPRLRLGIDAPPERIPGKDYVLGRFSPAQRQLIDPTIARACGAILTWVDQGLNAAMNQFNADEKSV